MASPRGRSEVLAEIAQLRQEQMKSTKDAVFGGWTSKERALQEERSERLRALQAELEALDRKGSAS